MRQFRWLTPLLLFFLNLIVAMLLFIGRGFIEDVRGMKADLQNVNVHVAKIEGYLWRKIDQ